MTLVVETTTPFSVEEGFQINEPLLHQVVVAKASQLRSDTARQKNRSAVRGGGRKPWRQKGTGRARAGTTRGPLWRGGGVTFANTGRNYFKKVNKKMQYAAMRNLLSHMQVNDMLHVVNDFVLDTPSTRQALALISEFQQAKQRLLFVIETLEYNVYLSFRNIPYIALVDAASLGILDLAHCDKAVFTTVACAQIAEKYSLK